jgi:DNA-binding LytR/AlgR family response regulator
MNKMITTKFSIKDKRTALVLTLLVLAFVVLTLSQDFLRAKLKNSSFYISESFMFSSFWWLFAPLLFTQYLVVANKIQKKVAFQVLVIVLPIVIHLFAFPFLVWAISKLFYYHTFAFQRTFKYTLSEHFYLLVLLYSIPILVFQFFTKKAKTSATITETQSENSTTHFINKCLVTDRNKKVSIAVSEILYFSANPPYINIHLEDNKYLYNETLKSISMKLDPEQFVRVHKSTIINIEMVDSYTTRLNGDYDLMMKNKVQLRVSRNFAADFKNLLSKTHRLTTK